MLLFSMLCYVIMFIIIRVLVSFFGGHCNEEESFEMVK